MSVLQPHSTSLRTLSASNSSSSSSSVYDINLAGSDCRFFFEQSCNKGTQCVYRHCAAARHTTQVWPCDIIFTHSLLHDSKYLSRAGYLASLWTRHIALLVCFRSAFASISFTFIRTLHCLHAS
jgi:hypothetical protein